MTRKQERNQAGLWRKTRRAGSSAPRRPGREDDLRELPEGPVAAVGGAHDVGLLPNIYEGIAGTGGQARQRHSLEVVDVVPDVGEGLEREAATRGDGL